MDKTTAIQKKQYTFAEFEQIAALPENRDRLLELIQGEIREKVPTEEHGVIAGWIITFLNLYLMENPIGLASVEAQHHVEKDDQNAPIPDVSFIRGQRDPVKKGSISRMPDLAVEIKSPNDQDKELREKANYYLKNGSQIVWLIYPEKMEIEVYRQGAEVQPAGLPSGQTLGIEDTLDGGDLLPGFAVPVQQIFKKITG